MLSQRLTTLKFLNTFKGFSFSGAGEGAEGRRGERPWPHFLCITSPRNGLILPVPPTTRYSSSLTPSFSEAATRKGCLLIETSVKPNVSSLLPSKSSNQIPLRNLNRLSPRLIQLLPFVCESRIPPHVSVVPGPCSRARPGRLHAGPRPALLPSPAAKSASSFG